MCRDTVTYMFLFNGSRVLLPIEFFKSDSNPGISLLRHSNEQPKSADVQQDKGRKCHAAASHHRGCEMQLAEYFLYYKYLLIISLYNYRKCYPSPRQKQ